MSLDNITEEITIDVGKLLDFDSLLEIDDKLDEKVDETFSGSGGGDLGELSRFLYKENPKIVLYELLSNGHDVASYMTLSSFIDEKLTEILIASLEDSENASNSEIDSLKTIDTYHKVNLLRVNNVIDKNLSNSIREFRKTKRNEFTHRASKHVYSKEEEEQLKKSFRRGLRAFDKLKDVQSKQLSKNE